MLDCITTLLTLTMMHIYRFLPPKSSFRLIQVSGIFNSNLENGWI
jgi:hypothetical protein